MPTAIEYLKLTTPTDREIRTERIFNASRERVWKAITNPELITQWWGRGNKVVIEKSEFHKGGHWRYVEHSEQGIHGFEGRYREITPQERVVQTFEWDGMPGYVIIETLTLEDLGDGRPVTERRNPRSRWLVKGYSARSRDSPAAAARKSCRASRCRACGFSRYRCHR